MKYKIGIRPWLLISLFVFTNCDRFPRDNPIDPVNTESDQAKIVLDDDPSIDDDLEYDLGNNGDGVIEPGETVRFVAELTNEGRETATGVKATISSDDPCVVSSTVRNTSGNIVSKCNYGDIESDQTSPSSDYYEVVFSSDKCSIGDTVVLVLDVEDENDGSWEVELEFEIAESDADIEIVQEGITVTDNILDDSEDPNCNNDNRQINRGETVQIEIPIRNTGSSLARGLRARLISQSPDCVVFPDSKGETSETISYGDLGPDQSSDDERAGETDSPAYFLLKTDIENCTKDSFDIQMIVEDVTGQSWETSVTLPFNKSDVRIVYSTDIDGENNNDNAADPGEVINLKIELKNDGNDLAPSITLGVGQGVPPCIKKISFGDETMDRLPYGNIDSGQTKSGNLRIELSEKNCESGAEVDLVFEAKDGCVTEPEDTDHFWKIPVSFAIN